MVASVPQQFFGQSFSSSSHLTPNGEVIENSIYVDSNGNKIVNGNIVKTHPAPQQQVNSNSVLLESRPDWQTEQQRKPQDNSGKYVHDNSGAYKGK